MRTANKSKVVIARDASLHGTDGKPDEKRVRDLLDRGDCAYTGRSVLWMRGSKLFSKVAGRGK